MINFSALTRSFGLKRYSVGLAFMVARIHGQNRRYTIEV